MRSARQENHFGLPAPILKGLAFFIGSPLRYIGSMKTLLTLSCFVRLGCGPSAVQQAQTAKNVADTHLLKCFAALGFTPEPCSPDEIQKRLAALNAAVQTTEDMRRVQAAEYAHLGRALRTSADQMNQSLSSWQNQIQDSSRQSSDFANSLGVSSAINASQPFGGGYFNSYPSSSYAPSAAPVAQHMFPTEVTPPVQPYGLDGSTPSPAMQFYQPFLQ
jgi:hypothetical protein